MEQPILIAGIALGILVNLIALAGLIWKFGSWSGKVTTLLDAHAEDHLSHFRTSDEQGQRIAHLEGKIR